LGLSGDEVRSHLAESLPSVGLEGLEERLAGCLSGGQKKRLNLLLSILPGPERRHSCRPLARIPSSRPNGGVPNSLEEFSRAK
jgi:ABC-type uncharacterized transport system YnjBCD ATPase subunit